MTECRLRRAGESDARGLATLARQTFVDAFGAQNNPEHIAQHCAATFSEKKQAREIADEALVTLLAEHDGELAGYAQIRRVSHNDSVQAQRPIELSRLYVSAAWHGRGVAQCLMAGVRDVAAAAQSDVLWLGVWQENPRAIAFYRKLGFEIVGSQTFHLGADPQQDYVMAVDVPSGPDAG